MKVNISIKCVFTVLAQSAFNHVKSIISVLPNAVTVHHLNYNTISTTFSHQILRNMVMDFYLC